MGIMMAKALYYCIRAQSILLTSVRRDLMALQTSGGMMPKDEARSTHAETSTADARAISRGHLAPYGLSQMIEHLHDLKEAILKRIVVLISDKPISMGDIENR